MNPMNQWTVEVHQDMMKTGAALTTREIRSMYGPPPGRTEITARMARAAKSGMFEAVRTERGWTYRAIEKKKRELWTDEMKTILRDSWPAMGIKCLPLIQAIKHVTKRGVQCKAEGMHLRRNREFMRLTKNYIPAPPRKDRTIANTKTSRDGIARVASVFDLARHL